MILHSSTVSEGGLPGTATGRLTELIARADRFLKLFQYSSELTRSRPTRRETNRKGFINT